LSKLWQKENETLDAVIEQFEVGDDYQLDLKLASYDIYGSVAHARMLHHINVLTDDDLTRIIKGLKLILNKVKSNKLTLTVKDEDIHTKIENLLVEAIGDAGKKLHTGRSRNDQILVDTRLYAKQELIQTTLILLDFSIILLEFAQKYEFVAMPGYTHMQLAMPSSVGMWASSFVENFIDLVKLMDAVYVINDMNPLGSGAGYGVSIDIDRILTTELLGFGRIQRNSIYCGNSRGQIEAYIIDVLAGIGLVLNRIASDLLLFTTREFEFFKISGEITTGSSIMPQKKNLDVMELIRARTHMLIANETQIKTIITNLPSGYNRDYQETKRLIIQSFDICQQMLRVNRIVFHYLEPRPDKMKAAMLPEIFATDAAYQLVKQGIPFRDAYRQIGQNLDKLKMDDPITNIKKKKHIGGPGNLKLDSYSEELHDLFKIWQTRDQDFLNTLEKLL
jgi:argininosuccinate lyase